MNQFNNHMRTHYEPKYECNLCFKKTFTQKDATRHRDEGFGEYFI